MYLTYGTPSYEYSAIGLLEYLHELYPNLNISERTLTQAKDSKDVLFIDYINKNKLEIARKW